MDMFEKIRREYRAGETISALACGAFHDVAPLASGPTIASIVP